MATGWLARLIQTVLCRLVKQRQPAPLCFCLFLKAWHSLIWTLGTHHAQRVFFFFLVWEEQGYSCLPSRVQRERWTKAERIFAVKLSTYSSLYRDLLSIQILSRVWQSIWASADVTFSQHPHLPVFNSNYLPWGSFVSLHCLMLFFCF